MIQRQESTIYEEDMPVVMRRRGVTMRVRIVSVDSPTNSAPSSPWTLDSSSTSPGGGLGGNTGPGAFLSRTPPNCSPRRLAAADETSSGGCDLSPGWSPLGPRQQHAAHRSRCTTERRRRESLACMPPSAALSGPPPLPPRHFAAAARCGHRRRRAARAAAQLVVHGILLRGSAGHRDVGAVEFGPYAKLDHGTVGPKPFPHYNARRRDRTYSVGLRSSSSPDHSVAASPLPPGGDRANYVFQAAVSRRPCPG
ncbi:hypothetical protein MRX96_029489 [Rhipicephalus microplus]